MEQSRQEFPLPSRKCWGSIGSWGCLLGRDFNWWFIQLGLGVQDKATGNKARWDPQAHCSCGTGGERASEGKPLFWSWAPWCLRKSFLLRLISQLQVISRELEDWGVVQVLGQQVIWEHLVTNYTLIRPACLPSHFLSICTWNHYITHIHTYIHTHNFMG